MEQSPLAPITVLEYQQIVGELTPPLASTDHLRRVTCVRRVPGEYVVIETIWTAVYSQEGQFLRWRCENPIRDHI